MQVKLLRAVQEKRIRPLGSDTEIDVDFRVISATHQDLESLVQQGNSVRIYISVFMSWI